MLRGIDPILSPELLAMLRAMGHGDTLVIADANFPGTTMGRRLIRMDGHAATRVLDAVLTLMPLDDFVPDPAQVMEVVETPKFTPEIVTAFQAIIDRTANAPAQIVPVERFQFYDLARAAYGVIQTGETRLYGNIIVKKGVIRTDN